MDKISENRHARFKRLAEARTDKVLDMLDLIGNLSNKSFYEYTMKKSNPFSMLSKNQ